MNGDSATSQTDVWYEWLLHLRHNDNPAEQQVVREATERYADRVLDGARLTPGMTLADIGTGEGLIAFQAIDLIGPSLHVILTDISLPLLRHAERIAVQRDVRRQCTFLECDAEKLSAISDGSVDVVTTRAVLAYVADKVAALREFHRVLKPGGRISIAEPIFRDEASAAWALNRAVVESSPECQDRFLPLLHRWKAARFPDTEEKIARCPMTNYRERDLVRFAQTCNFIEIHLELHIDVRPSIVTSWDVFVGSSPHPLAPPLSAILENQFTPQEQSFFEQILRPIVEAEHAVICDRIAYLTATKRLQP